MHFWWPNKALGKLDQIRPMRGSLIWAFWRAKREEGERRREVEEEEEEKEEEEKRYRNYLCMDFYGLIWVCMDISGSISRV